ncbi:MAG: hypothetical protein C1941_04285 [Prosthecochloris sp.]|nr:hypothetical protein [Prosthecochloris sp.]
MENKKYNLGGDFSQIFNSKDYLAMINIPDEATCILRSHLILEEVLNLWANKITNTKDLYAGVIVAFTVKLEIAKNLGLNKSIYTTIKKINNIRNKFSHNKDFQLKDSTITSLKNSVNSIESSKPIKNCEDFTITGKSPSEKNVQLIYSWKHSNNRVKFTLIFITLILKITYLIQNEFKNRNINYTI